MTLATFRTLEANGIERLRGFSRKYDNDGFEAERLDVGFAHLIEKFADGSLLANVGMDVKVGAGAFNRFDENLGGDDRLLYPRKDDVSITFRKHEIALRATLVVASQAVFGNDFACDVRRHRRGFMRRYWGDVVGDSCDRRGGRCRV